MITASIAILSGGQVSYDTSMKLFIDFGNPSSYPGAGTVVSDLTANGNNGTLNGGVTVVAGVATFDGINDFLSFAHSSTLDLTTNGTISILIAKTAWGVANNVIVNKGTVFVDLNAYGIYEYGADLIGEIDNGSTQNAVMFHPPNLNSGTFYYLTFAWGDGFLKSFVDGVLAHSTVKTIDASSVTTPLDVGFYRPTNSLFSQMFLKRMVVHDTMLTEVEVLNEFNSI